MANYTWVEKYRPNNLDDICYQNETIKSLRNAILSKNLPHLIFFGPSGCGKTSTILALAKDIYKDTVSDNIIELNASDERGINVIRDKIKVYSKQTINSNDINNLPPWKIIILDEADTMTVDSQFALRRIMEQYAQVTRFCIICNYHNKIIDPIVSRCSLFRFKPINNENIEIKLKYICEKEKFVCDDKIITKIIDISRGDLRKAINMLQNCHNSFNNYELLDEMSGYLPESKFNKLINYIMSKDIKNVTITVNNYILEGYSFVLQIVLFHNYIINSKLEDKIKADIICKIIEIDQYLLKGCDELIQFMKLVYYIMLVI